MRQIRIINNRSSRYRRFLHIFKVDNGLTMCKLKRWPNLATSVINRKNSLQIRALFSVSKLYCFYISLSTTRSVRICQAKWKKLLKFHWLPCPDLSTSVHVFAVCASQKVRLIVNYHTKTDYTCNQFYYKQKIC